MKTVLITGASSGIGKGFAYAFAAQGHDLFLTARSLDKLTTIKEDIEQKYKVTVFVFIQDLSLESAAERIVGAVRSQNLTIDILVNNAGFSTKGLLGHHDFQALHAEMMVNMLALTELSYHFTQLWAGEQGKTIINIASAAAFQSTPYSAVYSASKSYVLSLTEALHYEYAGRGIYFLAVCPGPIDTPFFDGIGDLKLGKKRKVEDVIRTSFQAMNRRKIIAKDGWLVKLRAQLPRLVTRKAMVRLAGKIAEKSWGDL